MQNWIQSRLNILIDDLKSNIDLIASKKMDDEWKRDHYRYTFVLSAKNIFQLLNSSITTEPVSGIADSTKDEIRSLVKELNAILINDK